MEMKWGERLYFVLLALENVIVAKVSPLIIVVIFVAEPNLAY